MAHILPEGLVIELMTTPTSHCLAHLEQGTAGRADLARGRIQQAIHDILVRDLCETALLPGLLVVRVPLAEPLGAEVEGVSKGLVDTMQDVAASHEDALERGRTGPRVGSHENGLGRHGVGGDGERSIPK